MSRDFGYDKNALGARCLWCGRKIQERTYSLWVRNCPELELLSKVRSLTVGEKIKYNGMERVVRDVKAMRMGKFRTRKRKVLEGENPDYYDIFFDPPLYTGYSSDCQTPMFDTQGCATAFAIRLAELGHRLQKKVD